MYWVDYKQENTSLELLKNIKQYTSNIIKSFDKKLFKKVLNDKSLLETLSKYSKELDENLNDFQSLFQKLSKNLNLNDFYSKNLNFNNIIEKNKFLEEESLDEWIDFLNLKSSFTDLENNILNLYDQNSLKYENMEMVFKALYYNFLLKHAYDVHPELSEFSGDKLKQLREEYRELDQRIFDLKKKNLFNSLLSIRATRGVTTGPTKRLTEKGLLDVITKQVRPRISLRQLIKRSSEALADLKPCFIMSPMTLAELVRPQEDLFDILIIDEASQMRMEDAIGAMNQTVRNCW